MLGSSISIQALIKKIDKATLVHDIRQINWWYGRIFNLAVHFEPIPDDDFDNDYSSTNKSSKSISTPKNSNTKKTLLEYQPKLRQA